MRAYWIAVAVMLVVFPIGTSAFAAEYHVKLDGSGDFAVIQEAIDAAATGDTVIVHPGTYYENIHFLGKNIVLTSTDIWDRDVVEATVIDGQQLGSVVTFAGTEDETCELSGFTITNGMAIDDGASGSVVTFAGTENDTCELSGLTITNGEIAGRGAGIKGQDAECNIRNCIISRNIATGRMSNGAGMERCCGVISNCVIAENEILNASLYSDRAAVSDCHAIITECLVTDNKCNGMIWADGVMSNCIISQNSGKGVAAFRGIMFNCTVTGNSGTGVTCYEGIISNCLISYNRGGGVGCGKTDLFNCAIVGNTAENGGGLFECDMSSHATNCLIAYNEAYENGGGVYAPFLSTGITFGNCTIVGNRAGLKGGGVYHEGFYSGIESSIIWGNSAPEASDFHAPYLIATPRYSCIRDWSLGGEGNISDDPLFVAGPQGSLYLSSRDAGQDVDSPCIDAGAVFVNHEIPRNLTTRSDEEPDQPPVDMGFHYTPELPYAKFESKCAVNGGPFQPGDRITLSLEGQNLGQEVCVDVYLVVFFRSQGMNCYITPERIDKKFKPWLSDFVIPEGFVYGPEVVFEFEVAERSYPYPHFFKFGVLINHAGTLSPISACLSRKFRVDWP